MRKCCAGIVGAVLAGLGLAAAPATGQTVSQVGSSADAMILSSNPTLNYGAAGAISVSAPKANGQLSSVIKFDLSSSKSLFDFTYGAGHWQVQSATLQLFEASPRSSVFNSPATAGSIAVTWQANDSWVEGTGSPINTATDGITWNTQPSFQSGSDASMGSLAYDGQTTATPTYLLTLVGGFTSDVLAGGLTTLRLTAGDANVNGVFNAKEFGTGSPNRPVLSVTAVPAAPAPEPAGATLIIAAAAGWCGGRRRRRR